MAATFETYIGKKCTIYLPRAIVRILTLKECQRISLKIVGDTLIMESLKDSIQLALTCKKSASMTTEKSRKYAWKNKQPTLKALLDTSFILPTLGIDTGKQTLKTLKKLDEINAEMYYSKFTIPESLWTAVTLRKSQKLDEEIFKTGLESIMKSGRYAKIEEIPEVFNSTLKLHKLGHKDMIDNILYASSLHLNLKLLTLNKQPKTFIQEKGLKDTLTTPNKIT